MGDLRQDRHLGLPFNQSAEQGNSTLQTVYLATRQTYSQLALPTKLAESVPMYTDTCRLIASLPDRRPSDHLPSDLAMLFERLGRGEGDATAIEDAI